MYVFCTACVQCPQKPEDGVGSPRTGVTASCDLLVGAGDPAHRH